MMSLQTLEIAVPHEKVMPLLKGIDITEVLLLHMSASGLHCYNEVYTPWEGLFLILFADAG